MLLEEKLGIPIALLKTDTKLHEFYFELGNIFRFLELPDKVVRIEQFNASASRSYYANALERSIADLETLKNILSKKAQAKGFNEKTLYIYREAEEYLIKKRDEPLCVDLLVQLHKLISSTVNRSTEDFDLFTIQYHKLPESLTQMEEAQLAEVFDMVQNETELDPIATSWILHFEILRIKPFGSDAPILARLMQNFWLAKHSLNMDGLLTLEHELFLNRSRYFELREQEEFSIENIKSKIEFGNEIFHNNLVRVKQVLRQYFRKQVEYDDANPRQRNIMNYVFEHGYKLKLYSHGLLNKRQELIMYIIHHKGFVSTKELTEEFGCNRKTIQRDFNDLLKMNMVRTIGNGSSLRYSVSIKAASGNEELNDFMPPFLKDIHLASKGQGEEESQPAENFAAMQASVAASNGMRGFAS